jgi:hypothetical protein
MRKYRRPPSFRALQHVPGQIGFIHLCSPQLRLVCGLNGTTGWRFQVKKISTEEAETRCGLAGLSVAPNVRRRSNIKRERFSADSSLAMSKAIEQIVSAYLELGNIEALETLKVLRQGLAADAGNRTDCKVGAYRARIGEEIAAIDAGLAKLRGAPEQTCSPPRDPIGDLRPIGAG